MDVELWTLPLCLLMSPGGLFLLLQHTKLIPSSGTLHLLFPLSETPFFQLFA